MTSPSNPRGPGPPVRSRGRVAILCATALIREALAAALERAADLDLVAQGNDEPGALERAVRAAPQVVVLESHLTGPEKIERIEMLAQRGEGARVVVLEAAGIPPYLALRMIRSGARGILFTGAGGDEATRAIRRVLTGELHLPTELERWLAERHLFGEERSPEELLSNRELQVLVRLAQGRTNREIAAELSISVKTVDTHRANLLRKLDLRNNADLTRFAIQLGFIRV